MRANAHPKNLSRVIFQADLNGPVTPAVSDAWSWKAELSAMVTRDDGQTQYAGYTRNRRHRPARPYPMKLVESAMRSWYTMLIAQGWSKYWGRTWIQTM